MATVNRLKRKSRTNLTAYKIYELLTGKCDFPVCEYSGYGVPGASTNVADYISAEMKADWEANREMLLKSWQSGEDAVTYFHPQSKPWLFTWGTPGTLPWAAKQFNEKKS